MNGTGPKFFEKLRRSVVRRGQLLRGWLLHLRGARVGRNFGVGSAVRVEFPECLVAGDEVTIEEASFLHCLSARGVIIGSHSSIDRNLWLHCGGTPEDHAHGYFEMGHHSFIGCNAVMGAGGGIRIGNNVLIGQCVNLHAESHRFDDCARLIREQGVHYQGIVIEDDVWIGSKATILDGVVVGRGAVIGAGSVVTRDVPPLHIAVGVPARSVKTRQDLNAG